MTPAEFARLANATRLDLVSREAAWRVLVEGQGVADVARQMERHHQHVSRAVARIRAEMAQGERCPACGHTVPAPGSPESRRTRNDRG